RTVAELRTRGGSRVIGVGTATQAYLARNRAALQLAVRTDSCAERAAVSRLNKDGFGLGFSVDAARDLCWGRSKAFGPLSDRRPPHRPAHLTRSWGAAA